MMKKSLIMFTILISVVAAGIVKASTKARVNKLETHVVNLSQSERKAWDKIAQLNAKLSKMEQSKLEQTRRLADLDPEEEIVDQYGDQDEEEDEDDYNPRHKSKGKPSRRNR